MPKASAWLKVTATASMLFLLLLSVPGAISPKDAGDGHTLLTHTSQADAPENRGATTPTPSAGLWRANWSKMEPAMSPSARYGVAMSYDSQSDKILLFGGLNATWPYLNDTWAYDFNADTWTNLNPATGPSVRASPAMAYDTESDRVVLFGGYPYSDETWAYDFGTNAWTNMNPVTKPSARGLHAMAYDAESDRIILFGGDANPYSNETWAYDFNTNTWAKQNPLVRPSARYLHAMAYDSGSDKVLLFGGFDRTYLKDTWAYDFNADTWTNLDVATGPSVRGGHEMAYQMRPGQVVLFGGFDFNGPSDETWTYDSGTNMWTRMAPLPKPSGRGLHAMAYDVDSDRVILFGGIILLGGGISYSNETWAFQQTPGVPPSVPQSVFAVAGNAMIRIAWIPPSDDGGFPITNYRIYRGTEPGNLSLLTDVGDVLEYLDTGLTFNVTYYYEVSAVNAVGEGPPSNEASAHPIEVPSDRILAWTDMDPKPSGRGGSGMAYDAQSDRVIVFGGIKSVAGTSVVTNETWAYDFDSRSWRDMTPKVSPAPRIAHSMAYDSESDRVILFGGGDPFGNETWAYDFDTNTWSNRTPAVSPSRRVYQAMAYDAESDRTIVFGGFDVDGLGDETWSYDFNANTWTRMNPATWPSLRGGHAMAYDSQSDRVILFGGRDATPAGIKNDTWAYDFNTNTWTNKTTAWAPPGRYWHAMAYDAESDRVVLFGGGGGARLDDGTWAYDFNANTWGNTSSRSGPSARWAHSMAYDAESDRVILFGGFQQYPTSAETWAYDFNLNIWNLQNPSARKDHTMAYDAESDRVILFGGLAPTAEADTWAYDFNTDTWTRVEPSPRPAERSLHAMAYDAESDRVILFGGYSEAAGRSVSNNDTWAYDFNTNTWTNMTPTQSPTGRYGHAMAYDAEADRVILFGGWSERFDADTWAYDFNTNTWTNMTPTQSPTGRYGHAMAYDAESDQIVLFGGYEAAISPLRDTWVYDFDANMWTRMEPALRPSVRYGHAMAYDAESDRVLLVGGYTADPAAETWSYDFNTNIWTLMEPAVKPSGRGGHSMAYDAESDRIILFGGALTRGRTFPDFSDETWAYEQTRPGLPGAPLASFAVSSSTPLEGDPVAFTDTSTDPNGPGDIVARLWDFGDGATATDANPVHTYVANGTYLVSLNVTDSAGHTDHVAVEIVVGDTDPYARFTVDPEGPVEGQAVAFLDSSFSYDGLSQRAWDFDGDGTVDATTAAATFTYVTEGAYNATLTVQETDGDTSRVSKAINVTDSDPRANPDIPPGTVEGIPVPFTDRSFSWDGIVAWYWNFGDGATSTLQNPTHTYAHDGRYPFSLTVREADGDEDTNPLGIEIRDVDPVANFKFTPTSPIVGENVAFEDLSTSFDGIVAWSWDFGDGTTSSMADPSHVYGRPGQYTVTLTVREADGDLASSFFPFVVRPQSVPVFPMGQVVAGVAGVALVAIVALILVRLRRRKH